MRWMISLAMIVTTFGVSTLATRAQTALLTGDTQVSTTATTTNYGTAAALTVSPTSSVLLSFDIADILPTGTTAAQVSRARLILYPDAVTKAGPVNVYQISSTWAESTVTNATKPTIINYAFPGAVVKTGVPIAIPVTGVVQNWLTSPSVNFGMEVSSSGTTAFAVDSKENTATSHQALLVIDLTGPAGPAGPAGPTGPKGATGATGPQGPAGGGLAAVAHNTTLTGNGTSASPLAVSTSLNLSGQIIAQGGLTGVNESEQFGVGTEGDDFSNSGVGVRGLSFEQGTGYAGYGMVAEGHYGIYAYGDDLAGDFEGNVSVIGTLSKSGGSFKIDHPLDPANKFLSHSFVESPDMMNIYNGNVVTDGRGLATVTMPDWFESLNRDFRYQLTTIGQPAQAWVAAEIAEGKFVIRTDKPGVKVSWQVTGVRQDAWANAHRIPVEEEKTPAEKGHYNHPELFGHAGEASIPQLRAQRVSPHAAALAK